MVDLPNTQQVCELLAHGSRFSWWPRHNLLGAALKLALFPCQGLMLADYRAAHQSLQVFNAAVEFVLPWLGPASQPEINGCQTEYRNSQP